jgi:DNA-binding transcriptional LysR family regulator
MKLHHLRDFIAIGEAGSVRGAARSLGLAQPALTRSLRELEKEVGAGLVERHPRGVVLTASGSAFLARARAAVEELRRGKEEVAQLGRDFQGEVTAGLSSATFLALVPRAFAAFRREMPLIRVHLIEGLFPLLEPQLRDGRLDFYIGPRPEKIPGDAYRLDLLFHNQRVVVCRAGHPRRNVRSLAELTGADWILTGLRERVEQEFEEQFSALGLACPRALTQADSMLAMMTLLGASDAYAFVPRQWADAPMVRGLFKVLPIREVLQGPDIVQIARARLPLTPAAERLATLMQRAAAGRK